MKYTQIYNDQTEGLFIIDEQELIRFSIVIAKENATAAFGIVTEVLSDIDSRVEDNGILLSVELIACLYPTKYKELKPLLLDPETVEDYEKLVRSLQNRNDKVDSLIPFLFSIDKEGFSEFKRQMINTCKPYLAERIRKIELTRMFDEEGVIQSYVRQ